MGDYHVDRPEVEGEQSLELTGTNRPETLTRLRCHRCLAMKFFSVQISHVTCLELRLGVT